MWDVHDGMMVSVERKAARLCLAVGTLTYKSRNLQLIISPPSTQPERGGLHDSTAQVCVGLQTIPSYTAFILRAPDSTNHTAAYFHFSVTRRFRQGGFLCWLERFLIWSWYGHAFCRESLIHLLRVTMFKSAYKTPSVSLKVETIPTCRNTIACTKKQKSHRVSREGSFNLVVLVWVKLT